MDEIWDLIGSVSGLFFSLPTLLFTEGNTHLVNTNLPCGALLLKIICQENFRKFNF